MDNIKFWILFCVILVIFSLCLIGYIRFRDGSLVFDISFPIVFLILLTCVIVSAVYCKNTSRKIKNELSSIKKGKEFVLVIPVIGDDVNPVNIEDKIVKLESDQVQAAECDTLREDFIFYVTQSSQTMNLRKSVLKLDTSRKCKMIFNNDDLSESLDNEKGQNLYVLIRDMSEIKKLTQEFKKICITCPEIIDGDLWIHFEANKLIKDKNTLKVFLNDPARGCGFTVYEFFIAGLFRSCPSDEESISRVECQDVSKQEDLWINTPDGKMAVYFLSMFSPLEVLGRTTVHENEENDLNKKIKYVLNYIQQNGVPDSEFNFSDILSSIREKFFGNQESRIPLYSVMNQNWIVDEKGEKSLSDLICKDVKHDIYKCIIAIACVYDDDPTFYQANYLILCFLYFYGCESVINKVKDVLNNYSGVINYNSPYYKSLKIGSVMKMLSINNTKQCTTKELVDAARKYLVKRYMHHLSIFLRRETFLFKVGPIEKVFFIQKEISPVISDFTANSPIIPSAEVEHL